MVDVFVSYKAEDRRRILPLVRALEADGLSVWWDAHIGGGVDWRESIQENLDGSKCVIVVWSKRSVAREGRFVRDEASRAQRQGTYLPVRIDKVHPPLGFGETQAISLTGWNGDRSDERYQAAGSGEGHPCRQALRVAAAGFGLAQADPPDRACWSRRGCRRSRRRMALLEILGRTGFEQYCRAPFRQPQR